MHGHQVKQRDYELIWSGFISMRRNKLIVGVDCFFVTGEREELPDDYTYSMNFEKKIEPEEILHLTPNTMLIFK